MNWIAIALLSALPLRDTLNFNQQWLFHRGEEHKEWTEVDLPHDFQISQPWVAPLPREHANMQDMANFQRSMLSGRGFKEVGIGWYRKEFTAPQEWKGKRVLVDFQGIMLTGDVYLNGERVGGTHYGYLGFDIDLSGNLKYGETNEITVRADTQREFNSRWYTGGGLYRDVDIIVTPANGYFTRHPLHIGIDGISASSATVNATAEVYYADRNVENVSLSARVLDAAGECVAEGKTVIRYLKNQPRAEYRLDAIKVENPHLWSCEDPYLYTLEVAFYNGAGEKTDEVSETFGIRTVEYSPEFGLKLNGEKVLLKGAANHHTMGALGAADYPAAVRYQLEMFKSFGYNHIRTSHNPYSEDFLRECDRLGILVVDELYDKWSKVYAGNVKEWSEQWQYDVEEWVKRDRNHPCVVMWSLGNELQQNADMPYNDWGVTVYKLQRELIRRFDPDRPVTVAMHPSFRNWWDNTTPADLALVTDIASYNYRYYYFDDDSAKFPWMIFYQSEANTTGIPANFFAMNRDKVVGSAYWGAIDYLGESGGWPAKGWAQGVFDISWQPKPYAYIMKSMFRPEEPVVHIGIIETLAKENIWNGVNVGTDHMSENWNRTEGESVSLYTFTNADEVELFVNGRSFGVRKNDTGDPKLRNKIKWTDIPYRSGYVEAVARTGGKIVARHRIETAGKVAAIRIEPQQKVWTADGKDLQIVRLSAVDRKGRVVWNADDDLAISAEGAAKIVAVGNGDITSDALPTDSHIKLFQGKAMVILRAGYEPGEVRLSVSGVKKPLVLNTVAK